jgi:Zn-dependent peptidase ImmA (M78 family)
MHDDAETGTRIIEAQAHDFASCFLLPTAATIELPKRLDGRGWAQLAELKRHWGISMAALLYRAQSIGVIDRASYQNAMRYMSVRGWRTSEPGRQQLGAPESPLLIERAIRTYEVTTGRTLSDLLFEYGLPTRDILSLLDASRDGRPIVEL